MLPGILAYLIIILGGIIVGVKLQLQTSKNVKRTTSRIEVSRKSEFNYQFR